MQFSQNPVVMWSKLQNPKLEFINFLQSEVLSQTFTVSPFHSKTPSALDLQPQRIGINKTYCRQSYFEKSEYYIHSYTLPYYIIDLRSICIFERHTFIKGLQCICHFIFLLQVYDSWHVCISSIQLNDLNNLKSQQWIIGT